MLIHGPLRTEAVRGGTVSPSTCCRCRVAFACIILISVFALAVPRVVALVLIWLDFCCPGQLLHGFVLLQPRTDSVVPIG
ncbi:hypothetical protein P167DRAFT_391631 [Morchella conica CCBAS932]|uniref:Uncharacterized protein n=1 Tax=Morchella conica CCBAS932 TaxID=1392247 RepID=A0A3N4KBB9_9PEZI|nr:hypothetical protein P167DRAFT_391631 [Morchella conica CCBAS932]